MLTTLRALLLSTLVLTLTSISTRAKESVETPLNFDLSAAAINQAMEQHHYNPAELKSPKYQKVKESLAALAKASTSKHDFLQGFREIWEDGPFSHVQLNHANQPAQQLAAFLDTMRVGGKGAVLSWQNKTAILTVNTMMGLDTTEQIDLAYLAISDKGADALIIDLRNNEGGAFAIRPLVSHTISKPYDAGVFVAQQWNQQFSKPPTTEQLATIQPWQGWSIRSFWADVQENLAIKVSFAPSSPLYAGPIYVLTSHKTASAAEIATDALQASGRAVVIGEKTAGEMLSQKPFDIPGGMHLFLPIADYYSSKNGRIEGAGLTPNIISPAKDALKVALEIISKK